jgi:hypothetical protein
MSAYMAALSCGELTCARRRFFSLRSFTDVVAVDAEKTLRLVFARGVKADAVADALAERLEPKARGSAPERSVPQNVRSLASPQLGKASPALAAFKAAFAGASINRGTVVTLSAAKGGKLTCNVSVRADAPTSHAGQFILRRQPPALPDCVAGKAQKPIASPELCRALFDIYLGKDPVAPAAKAALGEALAKRITA